jgi:hypothetical protein
MHAMKRRPLASPFLTTVTAAAALTALSVGCGSTIVFNHDSSADGGGGTGGLGSGGLGSGGLGGEAPVGAGGSTPVPCPDAVPEAGSPCAGVADSCSYELGCDWVTATCNGGAWILKTDQLECNPPPCPIDKPAHQSSCGGMVEGQICEYLSDWPCPDVPVNAICQQGAWQVGEPLCNPPPPSLCEGYTSDQPCDADPSCRWLAPGCGGDALDDARCFPVAGCDMNPLMCNDAEICAEISHDPCWNSSCPTCHASAFVCLGDDSDV